MTLDALDTLRQAGFTYISLDMAQGASITAWKGAERKTYTVYRKSTLEEAFAALTAQIEVSDLGDLEGLL